MGSRPSPQKPKKRSFRTRIVRRLAIAILVLVALILLSGVVLRLVVTPEALRTRIASQLEKSFKRPVSIDHVSIVLHQGLKISGLKVEESEAFGGGEFLSSEFLIVKYKLSSLLRGRIVLTEVRLMGPRIRLIRRRDGVTNIEDMMSGAAGAAPDRKRFTLPPLHAADSIVLEGGNLIVQDGMRQAKFTVNGLKLHVRDFNAERPFPIRIEFQNVNRFAGRKIKTKVEVVGEISLGGFKAEKVYLDAKKIRIIIDGRKVDIRGTIRNFQSPEVDVQVRLPPLTSKILSRYADDVPAGIHLPGSLWELKMRVPYAVKDSTGLPEKFEIEKLKVTALPLHVIVSGEVGPKGESSRLNVEIPRIKLDKVGGILNELSWRNMKGTLEGKMGLAGPLKALRLKSLSLSLKNFSTNLKMNRGLFNADIRLKGTRGLANLAVRVSRGRFVAYGNAFSDLDFDFFVRGKDLIFKKINLTWNESKIELRGCMKNFKKKEKVFFDGVVDKFKVDETYGAIDNIIILRKKEKGLPIVKGEDWATRFRYGIPSQYPDIMGRLVFKEATSPNFNSQNFKLELDIRDIRKGLDDVNGNFKIGFGPGRIRNVPDVRKGNGLLNVLLLPFSYMHEIYQKARFSMDTVVLDNMDITRAYGDFSVKKGKVDVRYIHFDSPFFAAYADGTADFSMETVDMDVLVRLMKDGARLADKLVDTRQRPSIRIGVKDDLNKPTAVISLKKIQANDLEEALERGLKRGTLMPPVDDKLTCGGKG